MKKRIKLAMLGMTAVLFGLTACGNKQEAASKEGKTTIRFASWDTADDVDAQQKMVDKFNEEHPDIQVVLEAYGSDFDTKISASMGSGDAPDVMYMWNYPAYHEGLEPLDSYIEKEGEEYKKNFYSTLWNYNSYDGQIYGLPVGFTTHCVYYNKDLFEKAGVEEPKDGWTWEDLEEKAKKINEATGVKGFSFSMKPDPYDYEMYLWSNGTAYCDKEGKMEGYVDSDKALETYKMFQDMEKDGYAVATEKSGSDEFESGQTAMFVYGAWAVKKYTEAGVNFGLAKLPSFGTEKSASILSSSGVAIAKSSKNKEAAWEFVKYWTDEENNKSRIGTEFPVLVSVVESEKILDKPEYAPFYAMLDQSGEYTPASFIMDKWSEVSEKLELAFEEMYNPSSLMDVKEAIASVLN